MNTKHSNFDQVFKTVYTPFNLEDMLIERLTLGLDIQDIREAAEFFYSQKEFNRVERNWFVNTSVEVFKECYL